MLYKKIIISFLTLFLSTNLLFSFPPRNAKIFEQNCLRLLSNSQYSYLTEYFTRYYPLFSSQTKVDYIEKMLTRIPFSQQKKKILSTYFKAAKKKDNQIIFLAGQLELFIDNPESAIDYFKQYQGKNKEFYLGLAYQKAGNFVDAESIYLKLIKKNNLVGEQARVLLIKIYLKWKDKKKALLHIKKIKDPTLKKSLTNLANQ